MGFLRRMQIRLFGRDRIDGGSVELSREFAAMLEAGGHPARVYGGEDTDGLSFMVVEDVYGTPLATVSGRPVPRGRGYLVAAAPLHEGHEAWFFAWPGRGAMEQPSVLSETLAVLAAAGLVDRSPDSAAAAPPPAGGVYSPAGE